MKEKEEDIFQAILWRDYKGEMSPEEECAIKYAISEYKADPAQLDDPHKFWDIVKYFQAGYNFRQTEIDELKKERDGLREYWINREG